jgi:hypothetical protein
MASIPHTLPNVTLTISKVNALIFEFLAGRNSNINALN